LILDAFLGEGGLAGFGEAGQGQGGQQPDHRDHNHDLDQRKALAIVAPFFMPLRILKSNADARNRLQSCQPYLCSTES